MNAIEQALTDRCLLAVLNPRDLDSYGAEKELATNPEHLGEIDQLAGGWRQQFLFVLVDGRMGHAGALRELAQRQTGGLAGSKQLLSDHGEQPREFTNVAICDQA